MILIIAVQVKLKNLQKRDKILEIILMILEIMLKNFQQRHKLLEKGQKRYVKLKKKVEKSYMLMLK